MRFLKVIGIASCFVCSIYYLACSLVSWRYVHNKPFYLYSKNSLTDFPKVLDESWVKTKDSVISTHFHKQTTQKNAWPSNNAYANKSKLQGDYDPGILDGLENIFNTTKQVLLVSGKHMLSSVLSHLDDINKIPMPFNMSLDKPQKLQTPLQAQITSSVQKVFANARSTISNSGTTGKKQSKNFTNASLCSTEPVLCTFQQAILRHLTGRRPPLLPFFPTSTTAASPGGNMSTSSNISAATNAENLVRSIQPDNLSAVRVEVPVEVQPPLHIHVQPRLLKFFKQPAWLTNAALKRCDAARRCEVVTAATGGGGNRGGNRSSEVGGNGSEVHMVLFNVPPEQRANRLYAVVNLEAHNLLNLPNYRPDWMLVSYHRSSDVIIGYGYVVSSSMGLCLGQLPSPKTCENMLDKNSHFYRWCNSSFEGDPVRCILNVMPHMILTNGFRREEKRLAVAWVSASCNRHNNYLKRLMAHMQVDMMGKCFRNAQEGKHRAMEMRDVDGLWGRGLNVTAPRRDRQSSKILIASQYLFYISVENTILEDYVTEKFFVGFLADTVMVYLGAPNARDYAPAAGSFINALDYPSPEALARHLLHLRDHPDEYHALTTWRRTATHPAETSRDLRQPLATGGPVRQQTDGGVDASEPLGFGSEGAGGEVGARGGLAERFRRVVEQESTALMDRNSMLCRVCKAATEGNGLLS